MGMKDKAKNAARQAKGQAKQAAGKATGDERLRVEGKADEVSGSLRQAGEKVKDAVRK